MLTVVLLHRSLILFSHGINLILNLCLLEQFVNLQVHLFQAADQVEIGLLELHQVLVLSLNFDDPLLLSSLEFNLSNVKTSEVNLGHLHFYDLNRRRSLNAELLLSGLQIVFNVLIVLGLTERGAADDLVLLHDAFQQVLHLAVRFTILICLNHTDVLIVGIISFCSRGHFDL